jgi:hypothetical protein
VHPLGAVAVAVYVPCKVAVVDLGLAPQSGIAMPGPVQQIVAPVVDDVAVSVIDVVVQVRVPPAPTVNCGGVVS